MEANPETVTPELADTAAGFINRISMGVQSFNPILRKAVGRHTATADAAINASESSAEGMVVLHAEGTAQSSSDELYSDRTISTTAVQIRAIPYFAWGNRTLGNMQVWIRE